MVCDWPEGPQDHEKTRTREAIDGDGGRWCATGRKARAEEGGRAGTSSSGARARPHPTPAPLSAPPAPFAPHHPHPLLPLALLPLPPHPPNTTKVLFSINRFHNALKAPPPPAQVGFFRPFAADRHDPRIQLVRDVFNIKVDQPPPPSHTHGSLPRRSRSLPRRGWVGAGAGAGTGTRGWELGVCVCA